MHLYLSLHLALIVMLVAIPKHHAGEIADRTFTAQLDGTTQRYVLRLPADFDPDQPHDLMVALHGHGADRWQFVRDKRAECRAARDAADAHDMILVSPDYRAKTSWMGPAAEADMVQLIGILRADYTIRHIIWVGASMGGASVLTFAVLHPDLVHGAVAMNGLANHMTYTKFQGAISASFGDKKGSANSQFRRRSAEFFPDRLTMPISFTVGGRDTVVPPDSVLRLAKALASEKRPVHLIHREDGGHATTYDDATAAITFVIDRVSQLSPQPAAAAN